MPKLELVAAKAQMVKSLEEYYNSIRTNIQFSGRNYKIITLTSAQPGKINDIDEYCYFLC